jgi:hypothetical protein
MTSEPMSDSRVCCFCGKSEPEPSSVELRVFPTADRIEAQVLWCHQACLAGRLHPSIPRPPALDTAGANTLEAARTLLALLDAKDTADVLETRLRLALDELAVAYAVTPEPSYSTEYPESARGDYAAMRERCASAFPGLGWYHAVVVLLSSAVEPTVSNGDALDDLTDIALDLEEVVERSKTSIEDAVWHFRFGFQTHWGRHLRWLQLVLHERGPGAAAASTVR